MLVPKAFKKQRGLSLWFCASQRKAKVKIARPGAGGRRPFVTTFANVTLDEARQQYWAFRKFVLENGRKPNDRPKLGAFEHMPTFREYLERYGVPGILNEKTARDQGYIVKRDLLPAFGDLALDRITKAEVQGFFDSLRARGQSSYTIVQKVAVLRKILRHAVENEIVPKVPLFPAPPARRQTRLEVTDAEILGRFLSAFDNPGSGGIQPRYHDDLMRAARPFFEIAAHTGLALSDLLTLRWSDIDFERGVIRRERNKTGVIATIPLNAPARRALQETKGRAVVSSEFVFVVPGTVRQYSKTTIKRYFRRAKELAGIKKRFRFHDLRHAFLTRLASKGLGAFLVREAAGHANVRTSQRYVHSVTPEAIEMIRRALE